MVYIYALLLVIASSSVPLIADHESLSYKSIREVPIKDNGEPLVNLKDQKIIAHAIKFTLKNPDCTLVRKTVYDKLCEAQKLLPNGMRFEFNVGLRSLNVQAKLFDEIYSEKRKEFPHMSEKELFEKTSKFVAPVKSWEGVVNVPPHSTGGAIDIVLMDHEGRHVDMGIKEHDPYNEDIIRTDSPHISLEARKNRDIMGKALSAVGFVNYPGEFWHWSYGDRRWAFETHSPHAIYGPVEK